MPKLISSKIFNRKNEDNVRTFISEERDIIFNDGTFDNVINVTLLDEALKRIDEVGNIYFSEIPKDEDYMKTFTSIVHVIQSVKNNVQAKEKLIEHIREFFSHVKNYNPGTPYSYFLGCTNTLNNMFSNINCSPFCAVAMKDNEDDKCSHNVFAYFDSMYHLNLNKDSDQADIFIPQFVKKIDTESIQSLKDMGISKVSLYTMGKNKFISIKDVELINSFKNGGLEVTEKIFDGEKLRELRDTETSNELTGLQIFAICLFVIIVIIIIAIIIWVWYIGNSYVPITKKQSDDDRESGFIDSNINTINPTNKSPNMNLKIDEEQLKKIKNIYSLTDVKPPPSPPNMNLKIDEEQLKKIKNIYSLTDVKPPPSPPKNLMNSPQSITHLGN